MNEHTFKAILKILTPGDKILIVVFLVLAGMSLIALNRLQQPGSMVIIEVAEKVLYQVNINEPQELTVTGPIGETMIKIDEGAAQVTQSDCPEKICIKTGKIRHEGEIIVCVPNRVVIRINGKRNNLFDVITQ